MMWKLQFLFMVAASPKDAKTNLIVTSLIFTEDGRYIFPEELRYNFRNEFIEEQKPDRKSVDYDDYDIYR